MEDFPAAIAQAEIAFGGCSFSFGEVASDVGFIFAVRAGVLEFGDFIGCHFLGFSPLE